jgi:4'-phosphopantetheinyl transferase
MTVFELPPGEVHVWRARLDVSTAEADAFRGILDSRERARADRFKVPEASRRFVAARATLRTLLGRVTGTEPSLIEFEYGERGKPSVAGAPHFNASDSGDTVVVAVASEEVGVDIEGVRTVPNRSRFARRICTESELEQLMALPEAQADASLLRLWTYKEAALKAIGLGLPGGLRNVEVELGHDGTSRLVRVCEDRGGWSLLTAEFDPGLLCSVVIRGSEWRLVSREFSFQSP